MGKSYLACALAHMSASAKLSCGTTRPSTDNESHKSLYGKKPLAHPNPTSVAALREAATLIPKQVAIFTEIRSERRPEGTRHRPGGPRYQLSGVRYTRCRNPVSCMKKRRPGSARAAHTVFARTRSGQDFALEIGPHRLLVKWQAVFGRSGLLEKRLQVLSEYLVEGLLLWCSASVDSCVGRPAWSRLTSNTRTIMPLCRTPPLPDGCIGQGTDCEHTFTA